MTAHERSQSVRAESCSVVVVSGQRDEGGGKGKTDGKVILTRPEKRKKTHQYCVQSSLIQIKSYNYTTWEAVAAV